jgi:hypothetical protein
MNSDAFTRPPGPVAPPRSLPLLRWQRAESDTVFGGRVTFHAYGLGATLTLCGRERSVLVGPISRAPHRPLQCAECVAGSVGR